MTRSAVTSSISRAYDRTAAEVAASVTPTNYAYPPGDLRRYGAVGDGVTNDSAAFINARAVGGAIHVPVGHYKLNNVLTSTQDLILIGEGPDTILDFTGTIAGGNYALEAIGTATQIQELSGSQTVGTHTVLFASAPSLSVGDVFVIYNPTNSSWSGFRTSYRAGEWCEVESVSGSTVTTKSPLYDTYAAADVDVYKIAGPTVHLANFTIRGTTVPGLIRAVYCRDVLIENVGATHANDSVIYLDRCFNATVEIPNIINVGDGGDDYGISIGNSQHVRVNGGFIYARRHAVTTGGTDAVCCVPVRDCVTHGATIKNDTASATEAADFHGNTEASRYVDCTIYGGANLQGKDNEYVDCTITNASTGYCIYHAEVKGGRLGVRGGRLITHVNPAAATRGIFDVGGNNDAITASTTLPATFFLKDCAVYGRNLSSNTSVVLFRNDGTTAAMNFDIDGVALDLDALGFVLRTSLDTGTAASTFISVDRIKNLPSGAVLQTHVASAYLAFPHQCWRQVRTGTTAPAVSAVYVGELFVDTTADKVYVSTATGSSPASGDWVVLN